MNENNLNENTNPEVTEETVETPVSSEIEETVEEAPAVIEENKETDSDAEKTDISEDSEQTEGSEEADNSEEKEDSDETDASEDEETSNEAEISEEDEKKPAKKKLFLQTPVIIALCLVVATLLGYFAFVGFFLKEPEGVTWASEIEGATYYYEFKNDGTFVANLGSIEITSSYQKSKSEDGNTITVGTNFGSFYASAPATYTISGSRLFGNQTLNGSYGEGYDFTLNQATKTIYMPDLPESFTPDESLVGTWLFKYMGYDIYKVTFTDKGYMTMEFVQDGIKYNGVYTVEDGTVTFTYCHTENVAVPIDYTVVDSDNLTFMGYNFVREGSAAAQATADEQLLYSGAQE